MNKTSRRALAHWAATELTSGKSAPSVAKQLAAVLKENNMSDQVEFLVSDISWELEQRGILAIGKVTSATPLPKQLESALISQLKKATKADDVVLQKNIDKTVLGGIRVETSNHIWDATVARNLAELKEIYK